jgi:hypothetical protein
MRLAHSTRRWSCERAHWQPFLICFYRRRHCGIFSENKSELCHLRQTGPNNGFPSSLARPHLACKDTSVFSPFHILNPYRHLSSSSLRNDCGSPLPTQILSQYNQSLNVMNSITASGPSGHLSPPMASRKRKRAHQYTVSYSEVQEVDSDGRLREVIVIEDTPPPTISPSTTHNAAYSTSYQPPIYSAPIRTRARAAAEAQALSASSSSILTAPAPKKRKRDLHDEVRAPTAKKPALGSQQSRTVVGPSSTDSRSGPVTEDVGLFRPLCTTNLLSPLLEK